MKNLNKFEGKKVKNAAVVKGGGIGRGTRGAVATADNRAELL